MVLGTNRGFGNTSVLSYKHTNGDGAGGSSSPRRRLNLVLHSCLPANPWQWCSLWLLAPQIEREQQRQARFLFPFLSCPHKTMLMCLGDSVCYYCTCSKRYRELYNLSTISLIYKKKRLCLFHRTIVLTFLNELFFGMFVLILTLLLFWLMLSLLHYNLVATRSNVRARS